MPAELQVGRLERRQARTCLPAEDDPYAAGVQKGIDGEQMVGAELERRLTGTGATVMHSIRFLRWGDIDHLIVGAGGITVVDAKNWAGEVTVQGGTPRIRGWKKRGEIDKLARQRAGVRLALLHARPELRNIDVQGVMCLAAEPYRSPEGLRGALTLCGVAAAAGIAARAGHLSPEEVAHISDVLARELPRVHRKDIDALIHPSDDPLTRSGVRHPRVAPAPDHRPPRRLGNGFRRTGARRGGRRSNGLGQLIVGLASAAILLFALPHLRLVVPKVSPASPPVPAVSGLHVSRFGSREIVSLSAPARSEVKIVLVSNHRAHVARVVTDGKKQHWLIPRRFARTRHLVVKACVSGDRGGCISRIVVARARN